ncbi:MAG: MXAN_6640 family putative metalloprotease [Candidatus Zixiibacteriota bacterium]
MRKFVFFAFILIAMQAAQADEQKLSQAYEQQLIERVKSVFSPQAAVEAPERPICATPIFLEVKANWDRLSAKTKKILESYTERPTYNFTEYTYDTPEGHFKIHYVRDGDSAVYEPDKDDNVNGHPDWVDGVGAVLEDVWETEINAMGYNEPPSDSLNLDTEDIGGDGRYDIYLLNLTYPPNSYLGYTQSEDLVSSTSVTSHVVLDNDYIGYGIRHFPLEWLQVTAAHEFFHAIQMGYDGREYESEPFKPYWMEMSAVWMEDMVYDNVNDYLGYLHHFFNEPWLSLKTFRSRTDQHAYGSCVWPMYLQERFDTTIIRDIWEGCAQVAGDNVFDPPGESATDKALPDGVSFEDAFREFTVWNYFTGSRARPQLYYSEGELFPEVKVDSRHEDYPVEWTRPEDDPWNLASSYVVFVPDPSLAQGGIRINFDGHGIGYAVSALGYNPAYLEPFDTTFLLNPVTMSGKAEIYNWSNYSEVIMIPAVTDRGDDFARFFDYQAEHDSSLYGESPLPQSDWILQNFPNPFVIKTESDQTYFPFVLASPSRVRIDIFTLSGERIITIAPKNDVKLPIGEYVDENLAMPWNGRNEQGEYVSSGVYLYRFRTDRSTEIKKIVVIR